MARLLFTLRAVDREIELSERRRQLLKRVGISTGIAIVVISTVAAILSWLEPSVDRSEIIVAEVERGDLELSIDAGGTVVPAYEKVISSPIDTRVVRILRQPGETVEKGDEILELDTSSTRLEMERLGEQLARKRSELERALADSEDAEADLEGKIEAKELDEEILRYRRSQQKTLFDEGLVSEEAFRQAEVELRKATIELEQLRRSLQNDQRQRSSETSSLRSEIALLQKELRAGEERLELASARADRAGVLTWVVPEEGATIRTGEVIARIADLSSYRVEATVSDIHASRFDTGSPAKVAIGERVLDGTVTSIDPTIANGTIRFQVGLNEPSNELLRNNLRVDVHVITGEKGGVLRVRRGRFLSGAERQNVFVIHGETAIRKPVRFGFTGRDYVEVIEGLDDGDEIIISNVSDYEHLSKMNIK